MTYFVIPSRRLRQPQGAVRVNWSSPLARGLVYALHEPTGQDYVSGRTYTKNDLTRKLSASTYGLEYSPAYTDALGIQFESAPVSAPPFTLYCEVDPASGLATQGFGMPISIQTATDRYYRIVLNGSSGAILFQAYNGTTQAAPSSSSFSYAGGWYSVAAVAESTSLWRSYTNGVAGTDVTTTVSGVNPTRTTVGFYNGGGPSSYMDGGLRNVKIWNRALSQVEIVENRLYPFAFLIEDPRRLYFGGGATGGGNITFEALPSSLSLAGSLANLWANRLLTANPASFTFAGATASTLASRKVLANPSTLTMTGATGTLKWNRVFVASPGTLGFTGSVANFLLGKILTANPGSLNLTGATATVKKNSFIIADPGALSFVGQSAGLFRGRIMTADPGSLTLSGAVASLFHFRVLPADPGTLVLTGATATLAAPGTVQRARPSSDISSNGWLPSSGSDLYAMLDETSYNDSDYIYSPDNPTTQAAEVKFSAITDPGVNTGHVLRFRLAAVGQDTVFDVYLMCGATQIATWQKTVIAGVTTTYSETLTVGEAGNITDYSDLRIKVVAHA